MSEKSTIEWTDATWNPTTGCDRVSEGCDHCYALTLAGRLKAMGNPRYQQDGDPRRSGPGFGLTLHADQLDLPLRWKKPRMVFVDSMSDLFHADVPDAFIAQVFAVMGLANRHTFQVLTKRPGRMASLLARVNDVVHRQAEAMVEDNGSALTLQERRSAYRTMNSWWPLFAWPLPNVWTGTSVENQKWADVRIPKLLETPAAVRFLSVEPLLGPVDLSGWIESVPTSLYVRCAVDWVIVGGESGRGARPMHPDWARSLRDQCAAAGVPFFFKQWGEWMPAEDIEPDRRERAEERYVGEAWVCRVGKKAAGRELDGRTWDEMPGRAS